MKKFIITLVLACIMSAGTKAQAVFKEIYDSSNKVLYDTREDVEVRKIALFKIDALTYINTRIMAEINDTTTNLTDEQMAKMIIRRDSLAYFLYDYIDTFTKEYSRARKDKDRSRVMKIFRDASINNPLYNDSDKQFVLAYYNREDFVTQFSLDTDWIKAYADVRRKLSQNRN